MATLAGVPHEVVARAKTKLQQLELEQTALLQNQPQPTPEITEQKSQSPVEDFVESIQPDELSPRAALDLIYQLKNLL